ncbi:MAG: large subunit ribosomal protein [Candidatus Parcubacteria bacterium]|jgi:large subunit ribosomal protein L4|nr:large subunit ribosomal protein [Candidatus Parcubacteria bacterium]
MATPKKAPAKKTVAKAVPKTSAKTVAKTPAKVAPKAAPAKEVKATKPAAGSLEATIYSAAGASAGTIALPAALFGAKWNADLVHQVVVGMQANARPITAHTKFRGEVRGGGKKPWKQKGTGRARHGSSRSPIWRGGGVTHGPRAEKIYAVKINRKMRLAALRSVLSRKWADGEVVFVEKLAFAAPKTKDAKAALIAVAKGSGVAALATRRTNAAIIAFPTRDLTSAKSFRNIPGLVSEEVRNLNPVDLLNKRYLVVVDPKASLEVLAGRLA